MIIQEVLFKEAHTIIKAAKTITTQVEPIIEKILDTDKHIAITGIGKNADIAKKIAATWSSLGIPSFYIDAYHALHGDLGMLKPGQVLIGLSRSGNTKELLAMFDHAGKLGVYICGLTCNKQSKLFEVIKKFDGYSLYIPCDFEADELNLAPTCSSTVLLAVGDSIGVVASSRLTPKFTIQTFHNLHPEGSLGEQTSHA